jgi:hypothetical protein
VLIVGAKRLFPLITSWLSLALNIAAFNRARRNRRQGALRDLGYAEHYAKLKHQVLEMLWRLCETGGRLLCIALFAFVFKWWILAVLAPHGFVMLSWYHRKGKRRYKLKQTWRDANGEFSDEENGHREQWTMTQDEWTSFDENMMKEMDTPKEQRKKSRRAILLAANFGLAYVSLFAFIARTGIAERGFITMSHARIRYFMFVKNDFFATMSYTHQKSSSP